MTRWVPSVLVLAAFACAPSCVDTSAVDYHPPDAGSAVLGPDSGDGGGKPKAACRECMLNGACTMEGRACEADDRCKAYLECSLDMYCLNYNFADLAHPLPCVTSCAKAGMINGQTDPVVALVAPIALCAQDPGKCGPVCNVR